MQCKSSMLLLESQLFAKLKQPPSQMASSSSRKRSNEKNVESLLGLGRLVGQGPSAPRKPGRLARALLSRYNWGEISAATIQHLAAAAVEDGLDEETLVALSKLGTEGAYSGLIGGPLGLLAMKIESFGTHIRSHLM